MACTIAEVVGQFKTDVAKILSADMIRQLCLELNYVWRDRCLNPVTTIHLFLLQILHGNLACEGLRHLVDRSFTGVAYCRARMRLPLDLFERLLRRVTDALQAETCDTGRWRGHRTWTLDGSNFSMSDTEELREHFGQPSAQAKGCGFPMAHLLALFHAGTGLLLRVVASPMRTHDMSQAASMHPDMATDDILIADRGFASYTHLALVFLRNIHAVFRCHQKQIVNFRPGRKHTKQHKPKKGLPRSRWLKRLGKRDQLVEYTKPTTRPRWMEQGAYEVLPTTLTVREIRYTTPQKSRRTRVVTLVTSLLDPLRYPAREIAALYEQRWQVEVNFRHLKTTMKMEVLHCQTVDGIRKELCMFALAYNLVRLVMLKASRRQRVPLERISFVDALRWLRTAQAGTPLLDLIVNRSRPDRLEPRVLKRRMKPYDLMNKPREELRQTLEGKRDAA